MFVVDIEEWKAAVSDELDLPPVNTTEVLDLAREVAHGIARPAAPLTCLLVGLAVGAGTDFAEVVARVRSLIPAQD